MDQLTGLPLPPASPLPHVDRWSDRVQARAIHRPGPVHSILVLKLDHIGDLILGFDAMIALRDAFPRARIELLCAPWNRTLAQSLGLFDAIHTLPFFDKRADGEQPTDREGLVPLLPQDHYDLAIDLRVDADTRLMLRHVRATHKCGFDSPDEHGLMVLSLPHYLPPDITGNVGMHQSMLMLRLVRSVVDLFQPTDRVKQLLLGRVAQPCELDLSRARGRHLVVCNPSSGRMVKNWPADRFQRLIRWLAVELDTVVLLVGGPDQRAETDGIIRFCDSPNVLSAVGTTTLGQAVNLVAQASLFIGNDSGLTHVAARLDIPTVVLFSGIDPVVMWAALGRHVTVLRAPVPCSPCHILQMEDCRGGHACMLNVSESAVRASVRSALMGARRFGLPVGGDVRASASFRGWTAADTAQVPQRFGDNLHRYQAERGELDVEQLLHGFVADNPGNRGDLNRFYFLLLVFDQILKEQIQGDVAELGVYKGNTAVMLAGLARKLGATAYLLDTFEGFDAADLSDVDSDKEMEFADTSLERVTGLVGETNAQYVKGYFPGTADQIPDDARFCLVHIDCDLYKPFVAALHFFYQRLVPGGFLVMHDYGSLHWNGAERAVDEFFADKAESPVPVPDGSGTVVVRKSAAPHPFRNWYAHRATSGFAHAWVDAGNAGSGQFLAEGWSLPESFGAWGMGSSHLLSLALTQVPEGDLEFAAETMAPLLPGRDRLAVEVLAGGRPIATWHYDEGHNAGIRLAVVPRDAVRLGVGAPVLEIEFRPSDCRAPHDLDPSNGDRRALGMGLVRFRQRPL